MMKMVAQLTFISLPICPVEDQWKFERQKTSRKWYVIWCLI